MVKQCIYDRVYLTTLILCFWVAGARTEDHAVSSHPHAGHGVVDFITVILRRSVQPILFPLGGRFLHRLGRRFEDVLARVGDL
jgi:hypothetical protein